MNRGTLIPAPLDPLTQPRAAHALLKGVVAHLPTAAHPAGPLPKEDGVGLVRANRHGVGRHHGTDRPQQPAGTSHRPFTRRRPSCASAGPLATSTLPERPLTRISNALQPATDNIGALTRAKGMPWLKFDFNHSNTFDGCGCRSPTGGCA